MPAEEFSYTGDDVAFRVRSSFGDFSGAQLGDAAILSWINDGQREIVNSNTLLRATKYANIVANQQDYTFPNDKVLAIEAVYIDGYPIQNVSPQAAREYILKLDPTLMLEATRPEVWYERAGVITFYPTPKQSITNGLKLEYLKYPVSLTTLSGMLGIPDRYFNELVTYVIAQALEADENYDAASYKFRQFRDGLDRLNLKDNLSQVDLYQSILPDPDDYM
jgi:hypothetical protein